MISLFYTSCNFLDFTYSQNASKTSTKQNQRDYPSSSDPNSSSSEYNDADSDETSSKSDDDSITMEDFGKMDETEKTEHFFKSQAKAKKVAKKTATLYAQLKNWKRDQEKKATKKGTRATEATDAIEASDAQFQDHGLRPAIISFERD